MRRSKKLGVMGLFASGAVCIIVATIRVAQITKNVYQYDMGIDGTWLAIFGMMECSIGKLLRSLVQIDNRIVLCSKGTQTCFAHNFLEPQLLICFLAVIVGFVPSFAVLFRVARHKKPSHNVHGYQKQPEGDSSERDRSGFALNTISNKASRDRKKTGLGTTDSLWVDEADVPDELTHKPIQHPFRSRPGE